MLSNARSSAHSPASPMTPGLSVTHVDLLLDEPAPAAELASQATMPAAFEADSTMHFHARMNKKMPEWFCSFLASNHREKRRFRDELVMMKGAWPLLMKQRDGGKWTPDEKVQLKAMVQSASSVSPYLFIWAIPGSMLMLPFLAWFLDRKRKKRSLRDSRLP